MKPQITESSLDGVLERILLRNSQGANAFLAAAIPSSVDFDRVVVERQKRHNSAPGSADLVAIYVQRGLRVAMLLIENKIDAGFTPDQPMRYSRSRDAHKRDRAAPLVATLLACPEVYIRGSRLKCAFDGHISYESLREHVSDTDRDLLEAAIERAESPYEPEPVPAVMKFFEGYAEITRRAAPDLVVKRNPNSGDARPEASRTIYFDARRSGVRKYDFLLKEKRPASVRMSHQCWDSAASSASVKLMLDGWARYLPKVAPFLAPPLRGTGIYLRAAGRSLALVADTGRMDNMRSAHDQEGIITDALQKMRRIRDQWNALEEPLARAARNLMVPGTGNPGT